MLGYPVIGVIDPGRSQPALFLRCCIVFEMLKPCGLGGLEFMRWLAIQNETFFWLCC